MRYRWRGKRGGMGVWIEYGFFGEKRGKYEIVDGGGYWYNTSLQVLLSIQLFVIIIIGAMDNLTPDEVKYLCSVPPYMCEYDDVITRHFGDDYPEYVCDFLHDFLSLIKNFEELKEKRRKQEEEEEEAIHQSEVLDGVDLKNFIGGKAQLIDSALRDLVVRLETEFLKRKEIGGGKREENGKSQMQLSSIVGYLYTLKIDIKVMMEYLKSEAEMYEKK